jgi:hypothetical protein
VHPLPGIAVVAQKPEIFYGVCATPSEWNIVVNFQGAHEPALATSVAKNRQKFGPKRDQICPRNSLAERQRRRRAAAQTAWTGIVETAHASAIAGALRQYAQCSE